MPTPIVERNGCSKAASTLLTGRRRAVHVRRLSRPRAVPLYRQYRRSGELPQLEASLQAHLDRACVVGGVCLNKCSVECSHGYFRQEYAGTSRPDAVTIGGPTVSKSGVLVVG